MNHIKSWKYDLFLILLVFVGVKFSFAEGLYPTLAYDIDMAKEICGDKSLDPVEGVWIYPEDHVTVMILQDKDNAHKISFPKYVISVVETEDARLRPGDILGSLTATPDASVFRIELATEKKNDLLMKPKTCMATLGKDGETFIFKKTKSPFRGRLNLNFSRLLPGFWKIISTGVSTSSGSGTVTIPVGMIKIYPSYDGNGSSRYKIRYL